MRANISALSSPFGLGMSISIKALRVAASRTGAIRATRPLNGCSGSASTRTVVGFPTRNLPMFRSGTFPKGDHRREIYDPDDRGCRTHQRPDIYIAPGSDPSHGRVDFRLRQANFQLAQLGFGLLLLGLGQLHLGIDDGQAGLLGLVVLGRNESILGKAFRRAPAQLGRYRARRGAASTMRERPRWQPRPDEPAAATRRPRVRRPSPRRLSGRRLESGYFRPARWLAT